MTSYRRPDERFIHAERERVEGTCPECGRDDLARYPVVSDLGWELVTKCQNCLTSVSRERWHRLGHLTLLIDSVA